MHNGKKEKLIQSIFSGLVAGILLIALPLTGIGLSGHEITPYLAFPPLTGQTLHAPFSWPVFWLLSLLVIVVCSPIVITILKTISHAITRPPGGPIPWWSVAGGILLISSWILAWNRFPWFAPFQLHTFVPLWLGYIVSINGLTYRRSGRCLLVNNPGKFLLLFPASSCFWWFFEYLNRFSRNWHYIGVESFTPGEYVFFASLSFATVLPAVLSTEELLETFPSLREPLQRMQPVKFTASDTALTGVFLLLAVPGLAGIGVWPDLLFPMLWIAPVGILSAFQILWGRPTLFSHLKSTDWRAVCLPAIAALVCGFFWEMWNYKSLAHWEYSVPYVQRFHLFEMPLLGYAGYIPFGLECKIITDLLLGSRSAPPSPDHAAGIQP
ncbi:hypothetical protein ACFL6N_00785 [Thermodesulfobacteriota bacterium]